MSIIFNFVCVWSIYVVHNLKKSVSEHQKGNEIPDLDQHYETVLLKNFTLQFESSNKLKSSINAFIAHVQGILQSSK